MLKKKNIRRYLILLSIKNLFLLKFKKKLQANIKKYKLIKKFPNIIEIGNELRRKNINLSFLESFKKLIFIFLVAGDGFEPPTFRL